MPKRLYKATIQILVEADTQFEAHDVIREAMSGDPCWVDWQYCSSVVRTTGEEFEEYNEIMLKGRREK